MATPNPTPSSSGLYGTQFSDLPLEVRHKIYALILPHRRVVQVDTTAHLCKDVSSSKPTKTTKATKSMSRALLVVSKPVMMDCLDMLYSNNVFEIWLHENGETTLETHFSSANRRRIRHLVLVARSGGATSIWSAPRIPLWSTLLPRLNVLQLSISSSVNDSSQSESRPSEDAQAWALWIEPYLALFSEYLVPGTEVYVRDMRGEDVLEIFSRYIPPTLRIRSDFVPRAGNWWAFATWGLEMRVSKSL